MYFEDKDQRTAVNWTLYTVQYKTVIEGPYCTERLFALCSHVLFLLFWEIVPRPDPKKDSKVHYIYAYIIIHAYARSMKQDR